MLNLNYSEITIDNPTLNKINIHDFLLENPNGYFTCKDGNQYKIRGFICLDLNTSIIDEQYIFSSNHYIYYKNCTNRILEYDDIKTKLPDGITSNGYAYKEFLKINKSDFNKEGFFNFDNNTEINRHVLHYPKIILIEKITQTIDNDMITKIIGGSEQIENDSEIYKKIINLFNSADNESIFNNQHLELVDLLNDTHVNQIFTNTRTNGSYLCYNYTAYLFIRYA
jgi:hypothetical protein